jgi:NAD(P)H-hydrate epimerase
MMLRLTRAQVREVDRRTIQEYHVPGIVLMENAAREVIVASASLMHEKPAQRGPVLVVCGPGNNGGDGLAIARMLHRCDIPTRILLATDPTKYAGDALTEWRMSQAFGVPTEQANPDALRKAPCRLIVDAMFGTGLTRPPEGLAAQIIEAINIRKTRVVAVDVPSGLDCDTGVPPGLCIRAGKTVTFVGEKAGFANPESKQYTGEIYVGDIGCPKQLVEEVARSSG